MLIQSLQKIMVLATILFTLGGTAWANPFDGKYSMKGNFLSYSELSFELKDLKLKNLDFGTSQSSDAVLASTTDLGNLLMVEFSMGGGDGAFKDVIILENSRGSVSLKSASCIYFDFVEKSDSFVQNVEIDSFSIQK